VRAVLRGDADAGATFARLSNGSHFEAGWTELAPTSTDQVDVLVNAGSVPADCISVSARLDPDLREQLQAGFVELDGEGHAIFRKALGADAYSRPGRAHALALSRLHDEARRLSRRSLIPISSAG
jgi:ABC-type phosphate/phosphonate transport system substrate-binding protein